MRREAPNAPDTKKIKREDIFYLVMKRQPRTIEEIPLDARFVNVYSYPALGAAKLILDNDSEIVAFIGPRTENGELVYSSHSRFSSSGPKRRIIGSEFEMIEVSRIRKYIPLRGII